MIDHDAEAGDSRDTLGFTEEDPMVRDPKADPDSKDTVSIRLQPGSKAAVMRRADALRKEYEKDPAMGKFGPWSKHRILRIALETGLDVLEDKAERVGKKK